MKSAPILILSMLIFIGACRPVYNLGESPYVPRFEHNNELVINAAANTNRANIATASFRGNSKFYYTFQGGFGSRDYQPAENGYEKYETKESNIKIGVGLDDLFDIDFGLSLNMGLRKNRNIISRRFINNTFAASNISSFYGPEGFGDASILFQGIELIPYKQFNIDFFTTVIGFAIKHDWVIKQSGELFFEDNYHSSQFPKGRGMTYLDYFLMFKFRTTFLDFGIDFSYTSLPDDILEDPLRMGVSIQKRFQLKKGKFK